MLPPPALPVTVKSPVDDGPAVPPVAAACDDAEAVKLGAAAMLFAGEFQDKEERENSGANKEDRLRRDAADRRRG